MIGFLQRQAPVAQLDSASVFGTEGCRFESYRACLSTRKEVSRAAVCLSDPDRSIEPENSLRTGKCSPGTLVEVSRLSHQDFTIAIGLLGCT